MGTAIWIIIAVFAAAAGVLCGLYVSRSNAQSHARSITEEARREADMIKERCNSRPKRSR